MVTVVTVTVFANKFPILFGFSIDLHYLCPQVLPTGPERKAAVRFLRVNNNEAYAFYSKRLLSLAA